MCKMAAVFALLTLFALVPFLTLARSLPQAKHLYPLAMTSVTYDVSTASFQASALPKTCPIFAQSSEFGYASFYFNGSPISVGNFSFNNPMTRYSNISFAFWIEPDSTDGVFFEYRTDTEYSGTVSRVKGELTGGAVKMTVGDTASDYAVVTSSDTLSTGSWKAVFLTASRVTRELTVVIDGKGTTTYVIPTSTNIFGFQYPGTMHLGESWNGDSFFIGKINCAAFFTDVITSSDVNDYDAACQPSAWTAPSAEVPTCSVIVPGDYQEPLHLWPLGELSLAYDVTTLTYALHPENSSACPDLDDDGKFSYAGWVMDGSEVKQVKVGVSDELYSFSVALYIWTYTEDAVVMEYAASNASAGDVASFVVYLTGGFIRLEFKDHADVILCNVTSEDDISVEGWKRMMVGWNYGLGQLTLVAHDKETIATLPGLTRKGLSTPGTLTLGGASSVHWPGHLPQPFLGRLSCLALYNLTLDKGHDGDYDDSCQSSNWVNTPVVPPCPVYQTGQYHRPIHLWPLTTTTMTYDVIGNRDGVTPNLHTSSGCPVFGESLLTYPALFFNNSSPEVIVRIPSESLYYRFTLGAFIGVDAFQGRLMEYTMDDVTVSRDVISRVFVELRGEYLEVNMTTQNGTQVAHLLSTDSLSTDSTGILVAWDLVHGLRITRKDKTTTSPTGTFPRIPLGAPGKLKIGGGSPGGGDRYLGRMSCLSFFDRALDKDGDSDFLNECEGVILPDPPLFDVTTCGETPLIPAYLWPLDNVTRDREVMSMTSSLSPPHVTSCFRVDDSDPSLAKPHLKFDGSMSSSLAVPVNESVFAGDFAMSVSVKVHQPAEGVLLQYTSSDPATQGLSRILMAFTPNSSLEITFWSSSDGVTTDICSSLLLPYAISDQNTWTLLTIYKNSADQKLDASVNGTVWTTPFNCSGQTGTGSFGQLRFGGRRGEGEGGAGFRGSLRCLMLFRITAGVLDSSALSHPDPICEQYGGNVTVGAPSCPDESNIRNNGFRLVGKNIQPDVSTHLPMKLIYARSHVLCASACMQLTHCRSFVVTDNMTSRYECHLFDYVTKFDLVPSAGKRYYEIKN